MRLLFTSRRGAGHLHPLLPLATAAREAGHEVLLAMAEGQRADVEAAGLAFLPTPEDPTDLAAIKGLDPARIRHHIFQHHFADAELGVRLPGLRAVVAEWRPDVVVHEVAEFAGAIAAAEAGIPSATVSFGPMVPADVIELAAAAAAKHWRAAGLVPDPTAGVYSHLYFDICPPLLQSPEMASIPIVRPLRPVPFGAGDGAPAQVFGDLRRPAVYFTMGTAFGRDAGLFRTVIEGVRHEARDLLVTTGGKIDVGDLGPPADNVHVHEFIPQAQVLPHCDLVVTHGGSGTVLGALGAGLPLLVLPQGADQFYNGQRILAAGVGLVLRPPEVTVDSVRKAARELLTEPSYRTTAARAATEIASMPPPAAAVADLERLVAGVR